MASIIGHYVSEKTKRKIGNKARKRWRNKKFREMSIQAFKDSRKRPDVVLRKKIFCNTPEFRENSRRSFLGKKNPRWNGGKTIHNGYLLVQSKDHPFRNKHGYVRKHRLVVEKIIKRYLKKTDVCHHIKNKLNNSPKNIIVFSSQSAHLRWSKGNNINTIKSAAKEIVFDGRNH